MSAGFQVPKPLALLREVLFSEDRVLEVNPLRFCPCVTVRVTVCVLVCDGVVVCDCV